MSYSIDVTQTQYFCYLAFHVFSSLIEQVVGVTSFLDTLLTTHELTHKLTNLRNSLFVYFSLTQIR